jgi:hypothetical protein
MLKQTIAGQLDLLRCLERRAAHLAAGMSIPEQTACEQEADEQVVLLPSSVTVHFRKEERDVQVLTKTAGALLPYAALAD